VRGSRLEEGISEGLPVWSRHVGDPVLHSDITRRVDFALFMVEALENDDLVHEAPAIVSRQSPSALALAHATPGDRAQPTSGHGVLFHGTIAPMTPTGYASRVSATGSPLGSRSRISPGRKGRSSRLSLTTLRR